MNNTRYILIILTYIFSVASGKCQTVSGTIIDKKTNHVLPNVTVLEKSTIKLTTSNINGKFALQTGSGKVVELSFSCIGYEKLLIVLPKPMNDTTISVSMHENVQQLATVEVTTPALNQVLTESYSQTNIDQHVIEEKIATALIDVLAEVPGITKQAEYHSPLVLRGLGGKRLLVTKDGNRLMGNFPGGFMGQGVNVYDLAKVEVIKGPASVKYGPGAISGIINMESKSPFSQPGWHGRASSTLATNNNEYALLGGINWSNFDHAFSLSGRFRNAGDYLYGGADKAVNSAYKDKDISSRYRWENNNAFSLNAETEFHSGGPWGRPVGFNGTQYMKLINTVDNTWHTSVTASWLPEAFLKQLEASVYYDLENRNQLKNSYDVASGDLSYSENVCYRNFYYGWRGLAILNLLRNMELNIGTDGVFYRIDSPTTLTDYFLDTQITNRIAKNSGVGLAGIFGEIDWKPANEHLKIRGGLRLDYSQISEGDVHDTLQASGRRKQILAFNGTLGAVYNAYNKLFISLQVARACRMPDAAEMFIVSSNADGIVYGNPDLKPEYGFNIDGGLRGQYGFITFDCSLFANFLHQFISQEFWQNSGKKGVNYIYQNVDKARIMGGELAVGLKWNNFLSPDNQLIYNGTAVLTFGDKLTDSPNWFSVGVPLRNIPPFNTKQELMLKHRYNSAWTAYLGADFRYYATQNRIAPTADGGYVSYSYILFGSSCGITWLHNNNKWDLKIKGDNLSDNKYRPFESLIYGMGRNFKLMLSVQF
jgi:iron complex outermembrane receptor protein